MEKIIAELINSLTDDQFLEFHQEFSTKLKIYIVYFLLFSVII